LTPNVEEEVSALISHFSKQYSVNVFKEAERVEIVKAIGLTQGHWFKCPDGHFYCIGECGGATDTAKCPECASEIGGTGHQLLGDNRLKLAPEMDGASYAAWSMAANLADFDQNELLACESRINAVYNWLTALSYYKLLSVLSYRY